MQAMPEQIGLTDGVDRGEPAADTVNNLRIEQIREVLRLHLFRIIGNQAVALLVILDFFGERPFAVLGWSATMAAALVADLKFFLRVRQEDVGESNAASLYRRSIIANAAFGSSWALAMLLLYPGATDAQQLHLSIVATAMLCTAPFVLASMPHGVLAFSGPLAAGILAGLIIDDGFNNGFEIALVAIYAVVFPFGLRQHARVFRERVKTLVRLNERNQLIRLFLNDFETSSTEWLWRTDASHRIVMLSPTFEARAGLSPDLIADLPVRDFVSRFVTTDREKAARSATVFESGQAFRDVVVRVSIAGVTRWWELTGTPNISRTGAFLGYHGIGRDVTGRVEAEKQLRFLAHHDMLTGGRNRNAFRARLEEAAAASASGGPAAAIILLDLDRFKQVNDSAGHAVGDEVLREAFRRFQLAMPAGSLAARIGGDEFAAIVPLGERAAAVRAAEQAVARISAPITLPAGVFAIGASAGIAAMPEMGTDPSSLLKLADVALYEAKEAGKGCVRVASARQVETIDLRARLAADIAAGLAGGQFHLEYQPVVAVHSGRTTTMEALIRWTHPEVGPVAPREFLALAEKSGAIHALGRFTIEAACAQAALLPETVAVAVNLSPRQFADPGLPAFVAACRERHKLGPSRIEFEVTEAVFTASVAAVNDTAAALQAAGARLVLDDFGAGASSFTALYASPFAKLKIDRMLVGRLGADERARAAVRSVIAIGRTLSVQVSAEGVETAEEAAFLVEAGCDLLQGWHVARPMPATDIAAHLLAESTGRRRTGRRAA